MKAWIARCDEHGDEYLEFPCPWTGADVETRVLVDIADSVIKGQPYQWEQWLKTGEGHCQVEGKLIRHRQVRQWHAKYLDLEEFIRKSGPCLVRANQNDTFDVVMLPCDTVAEIVRHA